MALYTHAGGKESNSYVTVVFADSYLEEIYGDSLGTWADLEDAQKEHRLIVGAQMLGYLPIRGIRSFEGQALDFPRYIPNADWNDDKKVPLVVKQSQVLITYGFVHRGYVSLGSPDDGVTEARIKSVSIAGLLAVQFADKGYEGGLSFSTFIRSPEFPVISLMKPYISQVRVRSQPSSDAVAHELYTTTTTV